MFADGSPSNQSNDAISGMHACCSGRNLLKVDRVGVRLFLGESAAKQARKGDEIETISEANPKMNGEWIFSVLRNAFHIERCAIACSKIAATSVQHCDY